MVKKEMYRGALIFVCEECGFGYAEERLAIMCEAFCRRMGACNMEVTRFAVKRPMV